MNMLSEQEVRWAAQAWVGCAPCGDTMWRWQVWSGRGCKWCGRGRGGRWRWATIDHVLSGCKFGLMGGREGKGGNLYGARHSGSKVLSGGVKVLATACARQQYGWTVYTEAEPCKKAPFVDMLGREKLEHSRPDIFLVNNTDPGATDKKAIIIDLGYTAETRRAFRNVETRKTKVYSKMKKLMETKGGCGGQKGEVQIWGMPVGVKGGMSSKWVPMCREIGMTTAEAVALGKRVSANVISDGKVVAGV